MKEYNYTREITCPYCGSEDDNSWEVNELDSDGDCIEDYCCGSCEKQFSVTKDITVSYSSYVTENNERENKSHEKD